MDRGRLISFEGLDGAGKTTQIELLGRWLKQRNVDFVQTREPGGTALGSEIRQILLYRPELAITPLAEVFLFQADRAQHFATLVLPALAAGTHVITDRCFDSSVAYQGAARSIGTELVEQLSLLAVQGRVPDLTILLDLDPTQVSSRTDTTGRRDQQNRLDLEAEQFHRRLRQAFLDLAHTYPARIKVIDAAQTAENIHEEIVALVEPLLIHQD